ncbi:MAG: RagB/SusD family nutrient uptake outer membrane protein [Longimicrobiales bacterium]
MNPKMKERMRHVTFRGLTLLLLSLSTVSCDLDLENPNAPTEEEVLTSVDGILQLAVGMQGELAGSIEEYVVTNSLITDEWGTRTAALASYGSLVDGTVDRSFGVVEAPWFSSYRVVKEANRLIDNVGNVPISAPNQDAIRALANLYKGMAFGWLALEFAEAPIDVSVEFPTPVSRDAVLDEALRVLEEARTGFAAIQSENTDLFETRVLAEDFSVTDVTNAMLARYYLVDGEYQQAIDAAERVDLTTLSVFSYPTPDENPIQDLAFDAAYVWALEDFLDDAEPGDQRVAFWVDVDAEPEDAKPPSEGLLYPLEQYSTNNDPFPVYLPDEMKLIMAEAHVRLGNFAEALSLINEVRTQTSSTVEEPVAGLSPVVLVTEEDLLTQIAYERRYELYMQGLRWDDTRRLDAQASTDPSILFLPIPEQECATNPNAGCEG